MWSSPTSCTLQSAWRFGRYAGIPWISWNSLGNPRNPLGNAREIHGFRGSMESPGIPWKIHWKFPGDPLDIPGEFHGNSLGIPCRCCLYRVQRPSRAAPERRVQKPMNVQRFRSGRSFNRSAHGSDQPRALRRLCNCYRSCSSCLLKKEARSFILSKR